MRTKLNILGLPIPKIESKMHLESKVRERVVTKQKSSKKYYDRNIKEVQLNVGDWVRVKKPGFVVKGDRKYSDPILISRKISPRTYVTSDSRKWNISKLIKARPTDSNDLLFQFELEEKAHTKSKTGNMSSKTEPGEKKPLRRSERVKQKQKWMSDYVMH